MLRPRSTVSDIKATFEARNRQLRAEQEQQQAHSHRAGDLANMPPAKRINLFQKLSPPSIDAILDTVPEKLRPSWIGPKRPDRPVTPGVEAMKSTVTITFGSPGLQPPVFIGTSLSEPQWEPVEMEHTKNDEGEYHFSKTFAAEEGEYQYKLRLGPGDWWVCDDSKPKVDDGTGNQNNLVTVKCPAPAPLKTASTPAAVPPITTSHPVGHVMLLEKVAETHAAAPAMPDTHAPEKKEKEEHLAEPGHSAPESEVHSPLMQHETLVPPAPQHHDHDDPPLLRHESVTPDSHEQNHAPLFRHESMAIDNKKHGDDTHHSASPAGRMTPKSPQSPIPEEADPNDPTLTKFPTDHKGIMEHLSRAQQTLPLDQTAPGEKPPSPTSAVASAPQSLSSVQEDEEEGGVVEVEMIVPVVVVVEADMPGGPMTLPMTPKEMSDDDPLKQLVDESSEEGEQTESKAVTATESPFSVILVGLGFALAAAVTAVIIRHFAPSSPLDSMMDA